MAKNHQILLAGFGGQGILFAGHLLADAAMHEDLEVTWLPSYGPEMRGGTCNCSVNISDTPIGSPLVLKPTILAVLNLPSFDKFEPATQPGGTVIIDSSLISREPVRGDVKNVKIPATAIAVENKIDKLANVIIIGKMIKETGLFDFDTLAACVSATKRKDLVELNMKALKLGYEY